MSITIPDNLSKADLSPLMDRAKKEGVKFFTNREYIEWYCSKETIYMPERRGSHPVLSFCHEWGHARLYLEGRSPIHNRGMWTPAERVYMLPDDDRRKAIITILNEEVMAWCEVPTMISMESWMSVFIINCFTTYLDTLEVEGDRRAYWLNRLPC